MNSTVSHLPEEYNLQKQYNTRITGEIGTSEKRPSLHSTGLSIRFVLYTVQLEYPISTLEIYLDLARMPIANMSNYALVIAVRGVYKW